MGENKIIDFLVAAEDPGFGGCQDEKTFWTEH